MKHVLVLAVLGEGTKIKTDFAILRSYVHVESKDAGFNDPLNGDG
jgi:hypothetical protein